MHAKERDAAHRAGQPAAAGTARFAGRCDGRTTRDNGPPATTNRRRQRTAGDNEPTRDNEPPKTSANIARRVGRGRIGPPAGGETAGEAVARALEMLRAPQDAAGPICG
jgi:hypothetical protein